MGARQDVHPIRGLAAFDPFDTIDDRFDLEEDFRHPLHLVEDQGGSMGIDEPLRVVFGFREQIRVVERKIREAFLFLEIGNKGRFPDLSSARDQGDRVFVDALDDRIENLAFV